MHRPERRGLQAAHTLVVVAAAVQGLDIMQHERLDHGPQLPHANEPRVVPRPQLHRHPGTAKAIPRSRLLPSTKSGPEATFQEGEDIPPPPLCNSYAKVRN